MEMIMMNLNKMIIDLEHTKYMTEDSFLINHMLRCNKRLITIDGTKGTGKSTLSKKLLKKIRKNLDSDKKVDLQYLGPKYAYGKQETHSLIKNHILDNDVSIIERGPMSDFVYLTTRPVTFDGVIKNIEANDELTKIDIRPTWQNITYQDLLDYYELPNSLHIILYSSDKEKLMHNLRLRNEKIGKYLNQDEYDNLIKENLIYQSTINNLYAINPGLKKNVKLYDISKLTYKRLYEEIFKIVIHDDETISNLC